MKAIYLAASILLLSACVDSGKNTNTTPSIDPVAVADIFSVTTGTNNNLLDVLANDTPSGEVTLITVGDPGDGSTVAINNNQVEYTPSNSFAGGEQQNFSYTIEDSEGRQASGNITVNIQAALSAMPDTYNVSVSSSGVLLDVLSNDQPSNGVTITNVTDPDDAGDSTTAIEDNKIRYVPDSALVADDTQTFSYTIEDGSGDSAGASVTITLVAGPSAADDALTINKNQPHNVVNVLGNDSGAGTLTIDTFDTATTAGGRVWLHADGDKLVYQPPRNFPAQDALNGADSFNYTMRDDAATANAVVNITINHHQNPQGRPCEADAQERMDNGLPYCFDVAIAADTADGHQIYATVFVPADQGASQPPVMLHAHGFGESRFASLENPNNFMVNRVTAQALLDMWHEGYWVVSYDQRGFNASNLWGDSAESSNGQCQQDGDAECIDVMNPEREGRDIVTVVDWVNANLRSGFNVTVENGATTFVASAESNPAALFAEDAPDDPVLGTIGLSYGGGYQTIGTSVENALNSGSRVNAMVPVTTWFDIRYSLAPNDVPKTGWIQFLTGATSTGGTTLAPDGFLSSVGQEALVEDNVSTESYQKLYQRSVRSYCENNGDNNIGNAREPDQDGDGSVPNIPAVFIIQGQRDLLFNYNEAVDLAQCYEAAGSVDVRLLVQTEGHILPAAQSASYKGASEVIYIDETVYCDTAGATPLNTADLITGFLRSNLGGTTVAEGFTGSNAQAPKACTTHFLTAAAPVSGNSFASFDDIPVGGTSYNLAVANPIVLPTPGTGVPLHTQTLFTATEDTVISGIPTADLRIIGTGSPALDDARIFLTLGVQRSGNSPAQIDIIADQITPITGAAPEPDASCVGGGCEVDFTYPRADGHYPEQVGEDPSGRIAGFAVKLSTGDALVLQLFARTELYNLHGTDQGTYSLTVSGSVQIPVISP